MTGEEILWRYVDEESDELMLEVSERVSYDGFAKLQPGNAPEEVLAIKVLSAAMVKVLQIVCERHGGQNLAVAYMDLAPLHAELVKAMMLREMKLHGT